MPIKEILKNSHEEIIRLYEGGLFSSYDIAKKFNCSNTTINKILKTNNKLMGISKRRKLLIEGGKILPPWNKGKKGEYNLIHSDMNARRERMSKIGKLMIGKTTSTIKKEKVRNFMLNNNLMKRPEIALKISNIMKEQYKQGIRKSTQKGRPLSNYQKECLRKSKLGDKNPRWSGGISFEPYDSNWGKKIKREIRKRDNQICMNCGIHREKLRRALDVHHINYNKKITIPENLISLCSTCHNFTQKNRIYWTKIFQEKLSKIYGYEYDCEGNTIIKIEVIKNAN